MIDLDFVREFVYENFSNVGESSDGTHFIARCSICGDSESNPRKRRMNIDYRAGKPIYHCFNCGESGSFIKLYCLIKGMSFEEAKKDIYSYSKSRIEKRLQVKKRWKQKKQPDITYYTFDDCITIDTPVNGYLEKKYKESLINFYRNRKINPRYKLYIAQNGDYANRIIIPVYDTEDRIIYFQARALNDDMIPKYRNPHTEKFMILNDGKFNPDKSIIITEGILDALSIGDQGACLFGISVDDDKIKYLIGKTNKDIILAFDNDESGKKELVKYIKNGRYSKKVKFFIFPNKCEEYKDINQFHVDNNINIYEFMVRNSYNYFKILVKMKIK